LHISIIYGHIAVAIMLLDAGVNINILDESGRTPLIVAILCEQVEIVKLLLARGANPAAEPRAVGAKFVPLEIAISV